MKTAKSYNLLILFAVFALSLICAFSNIGIASVSAANDPNGFFKTSRSDLTFEYSSDNAIATKVADGDTITFVNQLIVDDLGLQLYIADGLNIKVELTAKSFDANGNKFDNDGTIEYLTDVVTDFDKNAETILAAKYAERLADFIGLKIISRLDFFVTKSGEVLFNEINTFPGMTKTSLYPKMAEMISRSDGFINELMLSVLNARSI